MYTLQGNYLLNYHVSVAIGRDGSRRKEISKKSTLDYKEVYDELVNQNENPIKMTATKEDLNNFRSKFW